MEDRDQLKSRIKRRLAEYAGIDGVSGHEHSVVARLAEDFRPHVDAVEIDAYGNIIATKQGPARVPRLMIAAHSDEIGGVVKSIEATGMIRFERLGGVNETLLVGRAVRINGHRGVIGAKSGHLMTVDERRSVPRLQDLYVDMGFDRAEEIMDLGIKVGDAIAYEAPMRELANPERLSGKALDNRISCVILLELAERLSTVNLDCTVHWAVMVQEEVGFRGAQMVTYRLNPNAAIVVDTMPAGGTPDVSATKDLAAEIGKGPVVTLGSDSGTHGIIVPLAMRELLVSSAERANVPYQPSLFYGSNSDAAAVHLVREGIPTGVVNIARRYSHSPVETLDINDCVNATLLLEEAVKTFGPKTDLSFLRTAE
ncbi:MAG: M42 family metallopeptidase [Thermomicrobiales bacterium]